MSYVLIENEQVRYSRGDGSIISALFIFILPENWSSRQTKTNPSMRMKTGCLIFIINLNIII